MGILTDESFLFAAGRAWDKIENKIGSHVIHHSICDFCVPWPEHKVISFFGFVSREELVQFAERVLELDGYLIRKQALTERALKADLKTLQSKYR